MKNYIIILVCILVGVFLPRPSARVEQIQPTGADSAKVLISSSILDHVGECGSHSLREQLASTGEWKLVGKAGLNPEEAAFLIEKHDLHNPIFVMGMYFMLAEQNYNIAKHLYYTGQVSGRLIEGAPWTKVVLETPVDQKISDIRQSIKLKRINTALDCDVSAYEIDQFDLEHFQYVYSPNSKKHAEVFERNVSLLRDASAQYIFIAPHEDYIPEVFKEQFEQLMAEFKSRGLFVFEPDLSDLSEPWCLCGHLSDKGLAKVTALLEERYDYQ